MFALARARVVVVVVVVDAIMTCVRVMRLCLSCVRGRRLKPLAGRLGGIRKGLSTQSIGWYDR